MYSACAARLLATLSASVALSHPITPAHLGAQDSTHTRSSPVSPGALVRVRGRALPLGSEPARVVDQHGDTLVLRPASGELAFVPLDRVTTLEVARGRRRRSEGALRGARIGAVLVGVPTLLATSVALVQDHGRAPSGCDFFCIPNSAAIGIAGTFFTGVATLTGAALGAAAPGTRWTRVDPSSTRVGVAPTPGGGTTLALGFRF